jgi:hypothetical protein
MDENDRIDQIRSYLDGDTAALLSRWTQYLDQHPTDTVAVQDYAEDVIMARAERHYPRAISLLSGIADSAGTGEYYAARILALAGDINSAVELLDQARTDDGPLVVRPAVYAAWLAAEANAPDACPTPPIDCLMGAIAALRIGYERRDDELQALAMNAILDDALDQDLCVRWTSPGPRPQHCPAHWLSRTIMTIGVKTRWLTSRKVELRSLCGVVGVNLDNRPIEDERQLVATLVAGKLAEACPLFVALVKRCLGQRHPLPRSWVDQIQFPKDPAERQAALQRCEDMLLCRVLDEQALSLWYEAVWVPLLENEPAPIRSGMHRAIMARLGSSSARIRAAEALLEEGRLNDATRCATPLIDRMTWGEKAMRIVNECEKERARLSLQVVGDDAKNAEGGAL